MLNNCYFALSPRYQLPKRFLPTPSSCPREEFVVSPCRPSAGWLERGGWIGTSLMKKCKLPVVSGLVLPKFPPPPLTQAVIPRFVPTQIELFDSTADVPAEVIVPVPLAVVEGHNVSVHMNYLAQAAGPANRGTKLITKKAKLISSDTIVLEDISRVTSIKSFLAIHELEGKFAAGAISGPPFKMSWTGSVGGKAGATTINNDRQFSVALTALLQKNKAVCQVGVEFDVNEMEGFCICNRVGTTVLQKFQVDKTSESTRYT